MDELTEAMRKMSFKVEEAASKHHELCQSLIRMLDSISDEKMERADPLRLAHSNLRNSDRISFYRTVIPWCQGRFVQFVNPTNADVGTLVIEKPNMFNIHILVFKHTSYWSLQRHYFENLLPKTPLLVSQVTMEVSADAQFPKYVLGPLSVVYSLYNTTSSCGFL